MVSRFGSSKTFPGGTLQNMESLSRASRESGSKFVRAQPLSSQVESGNVSVMRGDWNRAFIDELRDFPYGGKDDQVDAFVRAFTTLIGLGTPARKVVSLHLSR